MNVVPFEFATDSAKKFLTLSALVLMDFDLQSRPEFTCKSLREFRNSYVLDLSEHVFSRRWSEIPGENSREIRDLLYVLGSEISDFADVATIATEMALLEPWAHVPGTYKISVNEDVRRIALREILRAT